MAVVELPQRRDIQMRRAPYSAPDASGQFFYDERWLPVKKCLQAVTIWTQRDGREQERIVAQVTHRRRNRNRNVLNESIVRLGQS